MRYSLATALLLKAITKIFPRKVLIYGAVERNKFTKLFFSKFSEFTEFTEFTEFAEFSDIFFINFLKIKINFHENSKKFFGNLVENLQKIQKIQKTKT